MLVVQAWRSWRSARGVALLAAAALATGIGSAAAIYTVINAVMLKPLPYQDGNRYVAIFGAAVNDPEHFSSLEAKDAREYQARTRAFDVFGWFRDSGQNLTFAGEPHHVRGIRLTTSLAHHLGVNPTIGRWFEDDTGVVLSSALWHRLGGDPGIVGKTLTLDARTYTITGVMPPWFRLPVFGATSGTRPTDLWMQLDPQEEAGAAYFAYGRRRPDVTYEAAEADVKRVAAEIGRENPRRAEGYTARVFDLQDFVVTNIRPTLYLLLGAAALLFLIACANAAGLLLTRSVARARDTAIRVAMGANRRRLSAHFFAETLPIGIAGALGGILLSALTTPAIVSLAAEYLPRADDVVVEWRVVLFAAMAAVVATALSTLAPLWQAVRTMPADALGEGARASAGRRTRRLSQALVVSEIALAFAILAVSAALLVHLRSLARTSPGFEPDHVLTFVASIPGHIAAESDTRLAFQRRLVDALRTIPGVEEVAFANQLPLDGCCLGANIYPEGRSLDLSDAQRTSLVAATPEYVRAMRIPLRRGRLLTERDVARDLTFVVISETAARRYWGDRDPIGGYGRFSHREGSRFQVVGIVGDVRNDGLGKPPVPEIYILADLLRLETMYFVVRSARPPSTLAPEIRLAIRTVDPEQPIHSVVTMRDIVRGSMTLERVASLVTVFFAGAALLMAVLGIYGVVAYGVRQRTVEIGTRLALGATTRQVLSLVVGDGLKMAAAGVLAGVLVALAALPYLDRILTSAAYGFAPLLYSTVLVATVAFGASFMPAWRASRLSPLVAIRGEQTSMWQAARLRVHGALRGLAHDDDAVVPVGTIIREFGDSVREAESFPEAAHIALETLRHRIGAESVTLLEHAEDEYRCDLWSVPAHGFLLSRLKHYPHPLALTVADFDAWLRWARERKPQHVPEIERLRQCGARMAVPLRTKTDTVGVLLLGSPGGRPAYSEAEKQVLASSADVFALMIENARLTERALEQQKLRRDLALAAEVQRRLLPPKPPEGLTTGLAAFTLPARTVGGDYYDFIDLGDGRIGIAVADVSGKGISAALVMSVVQASLRVITAQGDAPISQLSAKMNSFLYQSTGANKYATFFYAQVEECGRRLRYVNAGHNPPYLVRCADRAPEIFELDAGGMVLGLFPEVEYQEGHVDLGPGDLLVAFTDGVTEALNAAGEEFGEERLKELLRETAGAAPDEIARELTERLHRWIGKAAQHDDMTVVLAKMNPVPAAEPAQSETVKGTAVAT